MKRLNILMLLSIIIGCQNNDKKIKLNYEDIPTFLYNDSLYVEVYNENILNLEGNLVYISSLDNRCKEIELFYDIKSSREQLIDWLNREESEYNLGEFLTIDSYLEFNNALEIYYNKCNKILLNSNIKFKSQSIKKDTTTIFKNKRMILKKEIFNLEYLTLNRLVLNADTTYLSPRDFKLR